MKKSKPSKVPQNQIIVAVLAIVSVLGIIYLAYYFGFSNVGEAYSIGKNPLISPVDLSIDPDAVVTYLPVENKPIVFNFSINQKYNNQTLTNYTSKLSWLEKDVYQVSISNNKDIEYTDLFIDGSESEFYLNREDNESDLKVSLVDGQILFENLHFIVAEKSKLILTNLNGTVYPLVISLNPEQNLNFRLNASSSITPVLTITIDGKLVSTVTNYSDNTTKIVDFNWTAPIGSKAFILKIISNVNGLKTVSNYILTVGNSAYLLEEDNFPKTTLTFINKTQRTAELKVEFTDTTKLQSFALPCTPSNPQIKSLFNNSLKKVYSYDAGIGIVETWNSQAPSDFENIGLFKGYFLEFNDVSSYTLITNCTIPIISPLSQGLPPINKESLTLNEEWNLVSIPGIVPLNLDNLQESSGLKLYQCLNGYKCTEIIDDKVLYPGKPYWIYASDLQELTYYIE